jgi:enamine deaminase RidA (YjgF/YER057c/UK114 family)
VKIEQRLRDLTIVLPRLVEPKGNYVHARQAGGLLFLSGKGPVYVNDKLVTGRLGHSMSTEEGYRHSRQVALFLVAAMQDALDGNLDRVDSIVKVLGIVNATAEFHEHPRVIDGCSDLFGEIFGERGRHARCVMGVSSLPHGIPVEIEAVVAVTM